MKFKALIVNKIIVSTVVLLAIMGASCDRKNVTELENSIAISPDLTVEKIMENTEEYQLLGRKGKIIFPDRTAEVEYIDENTMHWKTTDKNNAILEGTEKIKYAQVSEHVYFVNWIEETGFTVSQIIDTKTGDVKAYWSFEDAKSSSGKRSGIFVSGKFEFGE